MFKLEIGYAREDSRVKTLYKQKPQAFPRRLSSTPRLPDYGIHLSRLNAMWSKNDIPKIYSL